MSNLQDYLERYLALRHALGYKLRTHRSSLKNFVQFASERKATTITTQLALAWAMKPDGANPKWWAYKLRMVHHFALYVRARDHTTEVPPLRLLPYIGGADGKEDMCMSGKIVDHNCSSADMSF